MQKLLDQQQQLSLQTNKHIEQLQLQLSNETTEDSIMFNLVILYLMIILKTLPMILKKRVFKPSFQKKAVV